MYQIPITLHRSNGGLEHTNLALEQLESTNTLFSLGIGTYNAMRLDGYPLSFQVCWSKDRVSAVHAKIAETWAKKQQWSCTHGRSSTVL